MPTPRFSILVAYHQGSVSYPEYLRGIESVLGQTCQDFEVLAYHDGPLLDDTLDFRVPLKVTDRQYADWGNSLRDLGLKEAKGEYVVHFNVDNYLYPNALEEIGKEIDRQPRLFSPDGTALDTNDIIIYPIIYRGWQVNSGVAYLRKDHPEIFTIFTGVPPVPGNIDSMQLVMRRDLWLAEGGYYDKSPNGDGIMYERFTKKYGYRTVGPPLGEHF